MLETPHVIVGAAIATKVAHPILSLPLALGSHFVLDILPHWNPHINREIKKYGKPTKESTAIITTDSIMALSIGSFIAFQSGSTSQSIIVLLCCFLSVVPDVVEAPYYFLGKKTPVIEKWITWQKGIQNDVSPFWGILSQVAVSVAALLWIIS